MGAVAQTTGRPSPPRTLEQGRPAGLGSIVFGQTNPTRHRMVIMYVLFALNDVFVIAMAITPSLEAGLVFVGLRGLCIGFGLGVWSTLTMQPLAVLWTAPLAVRRVQEAA